MNPDTFWAVWFEYIGDENNEYSVTAVCQSHDEAVAYVKRQSGWGGFWYVREERYGVELEMHYGDEGERVTPEPSDSTSPGRIPGA